MKMPANGTTKEREGPRQSVVIRTAKDVLDLVNTGVAKGGNEKAIILIALGGVFIDAYDFTSVSFGLKDITTEFKLSALAAGIVAASIMVGALIGALAGGYLVDRLGRYKMFMADMVFFVVAALACALATNVEFLIVARFVMGIGIGIDFPVALAFIAEYTALRGKGSRVTLWQPMWYVATASSFAVLLPLYFLIPAAHHNLLWRFAVGFGAVPALIVMMVRRRYMDESPAWAAKEGDLEHAAAILRHSYGIDVTVQPDTEAVSTLHSERTSLRDYGRLFGPRYRTRTIQASIVGACQSIEYYAVGFFLPMIVVGFMAQGRLTSITAPLVFNFVFGVTGGFLGAKLVGRMGSWKLAASGFSICLVALVALGLIGKPESSSALFLTGFLLGSFVFFHAYGPGAQGMTMATLSYPTSLRGIGAGFGQATLRVGSTISLVLFPILSANLGTAVFYVVALAPLLGLVTLLLCRYEPVGQDVDAEDYELAPAGASSAQRTGK
jgi:MFS family permease